MDRNNKIVLAVVAGVLGGMMLLGMAIAIPVGFHAIARMHGSFDNEYGYGMMGERGGMMGPRTAPEWNADGSGCGGQGWEGRGGMTGPRGYAPQDRGERGYGPQGGPGVCPSFDVTGTAL